MDWLEVARHLAVVAGLVVGSLAVMGGLVFGAMVWFLNHPKD